MNKSTITNQTAQIPAIESEEEPVSYLQVAGAVASLLLMPVSVLVSSLAFAA